MKKIFVSIPIFFILIIGINSRKLSNYIYYRYLKVKIENTAKIYIESLKNSKKIIYEIADNLKEPSLPTWQKLENVSKKFNFKGFILIEDLNGKPMRWIGDVKDFNFENGFRAVFTTEGPYLLLCQDFSFGKVIISSPVPLVRKNIYLKNIEFFPAKFFFPLPDTLKPPTYSFLFKEEGPPILKITMEAITLNEFQEIFFKFLKTITGIYLILILFFFKINILLKLIFFRIFLFFISFELFPNFEFLLKKEIFHFSFPIPFGKNPLELAITFALLFLIILNLKIKLNFKLKFPLFLISSFFYLFLIKEIVNSSKLLNYPLILKLSIFLLASSLIIFWLKNLEFQKLKYFSLFFLFFFLFFPSIFSIIFLILGTLGVLSIKEKKFVFFFLLAFWALAPAHIFQRENLKKYIENSYSFTKLNQTIFSIIKVKNSFIEILRNWDWNKELPIFDLIEDKKELLKIIEKKLSLKELPLDYKLELYEGEKQAGIIQSKSFPLCILNSVEGFLQESESLYHLFYPIFYKGKEWGKAILHLYFFPPYINKKEALPIGFAVYDKEKFLQNSNAIFLPEKLEERKLKDGIFYIYQEGENYYLYLIPPWEFSFLYLTFGLLILLGAISSISFTFEFKSIYFLILFPLLLVLILIILFGFLFTSEQRNSLINLQTLWGSSIQKNVLSYIKESNSTFYYKDGILVGGEIIEDKFYYCPSKVMSSLPLKKPEIFEIDGEFYLFFEDYSKNLMGFKQPNLTGMEKPVQWLTEKTWGNIMFFYGVFLIVLIYILGKILNPIKSLSKMTKEIEKGKEFYEIKPIFGKEIEDLFSALKSSIVKLQDEEKTLKEVLNNLPVGVALFEGNKEVLSNALIPIQIEEIINLKDEGIFEVNDKIYQYKKLNLNEKRWIFFINDITAEIEKEKLSLVSNIARIVAHEIKNPLTPIKLSIEYLKEIFSKKKDDFFKDFPKISDEILDSLKDLESISSEFSDFTRLPSLKKERVNLKALFLDWLMPFVASNKIILKLTDEEIYQNLDPRLFKRALMNLLNNAWQSAEPSPMVYLTLSKDEIVKIEIIDEGPGAPKEVLEKLFEPYFTTKTSGTGLGLFISKKIIEEHKGKIYAENTKDKGLKITILLPL